MEVQRGRKETKMATQTRNDRHMMDSTHAEELKENLSEVGQNIRKAVSQTMPAAKEVFNRISDDVAQRTVTIEEAVVDYIREKPLNAVLIGAGLGLICGFLMRRK